MEEMTGESFKNEGESLIKEGETAVDLVVFETARLYVREFNIDDVDAVYAYSSDPESTAYMDWGPESREGVVNFVHSRLVHQITSPRTTYDLAVCLKETGEMIGSVALFLTEDRQQGELGYIFNKHFWGRGYASEAARGILRFGFLSLDLHRIYSKCDSQNSSSEAVMRRIGLRREGEMKSSLYTRVRGRLQWRSEKHYALLWREYLIRMAEGADGSDTHAF